MNILTAIKFFSTFEKMTEKEKIKTEAMDNYIKSLDNLLKTYNQSDKSFKATEAFIITKLGLINSIMDLTIITCFSSLSFSFEAGRLFERMQGILRRFEDETRSA